MRLSRRSFIDSLGRLSAALIASPALVQTAQAQTAPAAGPAPVARFGYDDVVRRARDLAGMAHDATVPPLPDALARLDYDSYRDIRFRADRALLGQNGGAFRMQMFHPGFLFNRTVTVNLIRDGIPTPVPYASSLFDYGRNRFDRALPVNLGFAGFRLHYPLNDPKIQDELISFLGASYYRFLGRGQR